MTNLQVGLELTCGGAEGTIRKPAFHTKHEKMSFGNFSLFSLSNISVEIRGFIILGYSATFYYRVLVLAFLKLFVYCRLQVNKC